MGKLKLNFKKLGEGPPIIIIHGLFGMLDNWKSIANELKADFTIYLIDQRDHGKSPHTDSFSIELLAKDLVDFVQEHNIQYPSLIGHSLGGKAVIRSLQLYQDYFNKSVVVDMGVKSYQRGHDDIFNALLELPLQDFSKRSEIDEFLSKRIPEWGVRQFLLKNVKRNGDHFSWKMNLQLLFDSYSTVIKPLDDINSDATVLFLRGDLSQYILESDFLDILDVFPNAQFETVLGAGHWIHADKPKELVHYISSFLKA